MKTNAKDYVSIAQQFFTAYDAHDVDGMLALCADGALGRRTYPSLLHSAFRHELQDHTARRLLGQRRPQQYQGERRVTGRANCKISDLQRHCSTDYMKAREVGNGFSRNQSTRHSSGSRCD